MRSIGGWLAAALYIELTHVRRFNVACLRSFCLQISLVQPTFWMRRRAENKFAILKILHEMDFLTTTKKFNPGHGGENNAGPFKLFS